MSTFNLSRLEQKYWRQALVETFDDQIIDCLVDNEGHLYRFKINDVKNYLSTYPCERKVWYFNETRDREIAEIYPHNANEVVVNPKFVAEHFRSYVI